MSKTKVTRASQGQNPFDNKSVITVANAYNAEASTSQGYWVCRILSSCFRSRELPNDIPTAEIDTTPRVRRKKERGEKIPSRFDTSSPIANQPQYAYSPNQVRKPIKRQSQIDCNSL